MDDTKSAHVQRIEESRVTASHATRVSDMQDTDLPFPLKIKALIILSVAIIVAIIAVFVPPDMDTFIQFQPVACVYHTYPTFNCGGDITVAGFIHWPHSLNSPSDFRGMGASSLIYYPLFLAFHFWQSTIILNGLCMALTVWLFVRLTKASPWIATIVYGANFFFVYNLLHDYQEGYNTALFFAIPWLVAHILTAETKRTRLMLNAVLGVAVFFSLEDLPVFVFSLPAVAILTICCNREKLPARNRLLTLVRACFSGSLLSITLYLFIVFARLPNGAYFLHSLYATHAAHPTYAEFGPYLTHIKNLFVTYLLNFPNSGGIVHGAQDLKLVNGPFDYRGAIVTAPFWIITLWLYAMFYRCKCITDDPQLYKRYALMIQALLASAVVTLLMVGTNVQTRHSYHLLAVFICLLGGNALCIDYLYRCHRIRLGLVTALLSVSQILCTIYVARQEPLPNYSWDRISAVDYVDQPAIGNHAVIVNLSWGTYFISTLYGAKEQIVYGDPGDRYDNGIFWRLEKMAQENKRYVVFIGLKGKFVPTSMIRRTFSDLKKLYPEDSSKSIWEVWGEPGILENKQQ